MIRRIVNFWLLVSVPGMAVYLALFVVGEINSPLTDRYLPSSGVWAVALGSLAIAILLALDEQQALGDEKNIEKMTFAGLAYVLFIKRKPILSLLVFSIVCVGLAGYYIFKSIGGTLETDESTLSIKLPGHTVYYFPISSQQGWQNTGIRIKAGQKLKYSITGYVSPGYLQDIDNQIAGLRKHKESGGSYLQEKAKWPFTGPEGYPPPSWPTWYEDMKQKDKESCNAHSIDNDAKIKCLSAATPSFGEDKGLSVRGLAHNRVVGIIIPPSGDPPGDVSAGAKQYNYEDPKDKKLLILFEKLQKEKEPPKTEGTIENVNAEGVLWVVINDADSYRWDNAGLFFLKLVSL